MVSESSNESLYPVIVYRDAEAALEFLTKAFAFTETSVHRNDGGDIVHAEMSYGSGVLMVGQSSTSSVGETGRTSVYVTVRNLDAHYERASQGGAKIIEGPTDTDYGSRDYAAADPEGNYWHFGTYRPDTKSADQPE